MGRFGRPHGIKGFVTVISFTDPRDNLLNYTHWHAWISHQWQPIQLLQLDVTHKHLLALVEGYETRETVARLTKVYIAIVRSAMPQLPPGDYYWHQLIGMSVMNLQHNELGTVTDLLSTGAHDVLVVEGEKRHLIPYLPGRHVVSVNDPERLITVDWDADF